MTHTHGFGATAAWAGHSICSSAPEVCGQFHMGFRDGYSECQVSKWDWEPTRDVVSFTAC